MSPAAGLLVGVDISEREGGRSKPGTRLGSSVLGHVRIRGGGGSPDLKNAVQVPESNPCLLGNKGKPTNLAKASNGGGLPSSRGTGAIHSVKGVLPNVYDASETYSSIPSDASDPTQVLEGGRPAGATWTS